MFTREDVRVRSRTIYDSQVARHRKKLQKSAGKGVKLEIPASEVLPYSFEEFFNWVWKKYGIAAHQCPWCNAPIDFLSLQVDHKIPIEKGGSLSLDNLEGICKPCNELKGPQLPEEYAQLLTFLGSLSTPHRAYLEQRIRAGAVANRMRFFPHQKKGDPKKKKGIPQGRLDLGGLGDF
jgi:5-methylcytosine-specific restriction endonuclease McrA